jgi:hypothetical protein
MRTRETQVGGDHYSKHSIQVFDIIESHKLNFFEGNALKYLLRYKDKGGYQDLLKLKDYVNIIAEQYKYYHGED